MTIDTKQIQGLLTVENFQQWLESLPPHTGVGFPRNIRCCPVATYLQSDRIKAWLTSVDQDKIEIWIDGSPAIALFSNTSAFNQMGIPKVPDWLHELIKKIDSLYPDLAQNISAEEVLAVLNEVKPR